MTEIVMSWPWYDRLIFGVAIALVITAPITLGRKLDEILKLLRELQDRR